MKVCIVTDTFPKLSETFILTQALALSNRGIEVWILSDTLLPLEGAAEILRDTTRSRWGALSRFAPMMRKLPRRAAGRGGLLLDLLFSRRLAGFNAIIAHFGMNGVRLARLGQLRSGFPPVLTIFHGFDVGMVERDGTLGQYEPLFRFPGLLLPVNGPFCDILLRAGAPADRTRVHHMGINLQTIPFRPRDWRAANLHLLSVCRLTEKKGIAYALEALALLDREPQSRDWRYTIVGDGELRSELESLATRLGLSERVRFLGAQPHAAVRRHLAESHVFLQPSVTAQSGDMEGIPVVLMEAMAAGLVAVSTFHSGIPELITNAENGLLAPERDVSGLSDKLRWIFNHPGELNPLVTGARTAVERDFNSERQAGQLISWIESMHGT